MSAPNKHRVRKTLCVLMWAWALLTFVILDLFRNVPAFDSVRPRSPTYRAMRYAAHEMIGEPYFDRDFVEWARKPRADAARGLRIALSGVEHEDSLVALQRLARESNDSRVRIRALRRLATEHGGRARRAVLSIAWDEDETEKVRAQAARYLGRTGEGALADLDHLADRAPPRVREGALWGYAELGSPAAVRALVERDATVALARVVKPEAVPALAEALQSDTDDETRAACCRALGNTKSPDAAEPLTRLLSDRSVRPYVRAAAADALGRLGHREALEAITTACNDPWPAVVKEARRAKQRLDHIQEN